MRKQSFSQTNPRPPPSHGPGASLESIDAIFGDARTIENAVESGRDGNNPKRILTSKRSRKLPSSVCSVDDDPGMQLPNCMLRQNPEILDILEQAMPCPPVTKATLGELDLQSIQNNLNLRIDINYDHDLYFQPVSGKKGDEKRKQASRYWQALVIEFRVYGHDAKPCQDCATASLATCETTVKDRLPTMFGTLRDLLEMLVPETDRDEVINRLDIKLLMQQVRHGALDVVSLSKWLASLLMSHCAPMRDEMMVETAEKIANGAREGNMESLVGGLERLFTFLEAMKLDVANHQIRTFRLPLIEDTVPFQRDCFERAIDNQQLDFEESRIWYGKGRDKVRSAVQSPGSLASDFECFLCTLAQLCCSGYDEDLPMTLQYDTSRFTRLQEDVLDLVQLEVCIRLFDRLAEKVIGPRRSHERLRIELKLRIMRLTEDHEGYGTAIGNHAEAVGMEITRAVFALSKKAKSKNGMVRISNMDFKATIAELESDLKAEALDRSLSSKFVDELGTRACKAARSFYPQSTLEISNAQRVWSQARLIDGRQPIVPELEDMARRLAHIGVVHWRVWSDLIYL